RRELLLVRRRFVARLVRLGVGGAVVARQSRRDERERPEPLRRVERELERDPAAEREADERRPLDAELVERREDVVVPRPGRGGPGRAAVEAEIRAQRAETP